MMASTETKLLTPGDVALRLNVSRSWVRKKAQAGELPYRRVGRQLRFVAREIEAWLERRRA